MRFNISDGFSDWLKIATVIGVIILFVWWLETRFSPTYGLIAITLAAGTLFFIAGAILSSYIQKNTLDQVTKFSAKDATVDRYRLQSAKEFATSEKYYAKADAQLKVIEARQSQRALPDKQVNDITDTFWEVNNTVDLDDWS